MENPRYGSWPLANLRMANALKLKDYDFRFSFGTGPDSAAEGGAEFPAEMTWLWRDGDPCAYRANLHAGPRGKTRLPFQVTVSNREP